VVELVLVVFKPDLNDLQL